MLKFLTRPLPDGATLVAFQDITADRRVEDALRERAEAFETADRLKGQFVENVSYQLRNPLQAIYGKRVRNSDELLNEVESHAPGETVTLTVVRGGKRRDVRVALGQS